MGRIVPLTLLFVLVAGPTLAEQPPEAVIAAMDVDMAAVVAGSIDVGDSAATMFDVRSSLGIVEPTEAPTLGVLFTGDVSDLEGSEDTDHPPVGATGDAAVLSFVIVPPEYAHSFSFDFYFLSREYPEWLGSEYLDTFEVSLFSDTFEGPITYDPYGNPITVSSSWGQTWQQVGSFGGSGWGTTVAPCEPGGPMWLHFTVYDVADGVWDSAVLLDRFTFHEDEVDEPWTGPQGQAPGDDDDSDDDDSAVEPDDDDAVDDDDSAVGPDDDDAVASDDDDSSASDPQTCGEPDPLEVLCGCDAAPGGAAPLLLLLLVPALIRRRGRVVAPPLLLLALAPPALAEQPPEAVMEAMEVDMSAVVAGSIDVGDSSSLMFDARSSLGVIVPTDAPFFGVMYTGNVNQLETLQDFDYPGESADLADGDRAELAFELVVPEGASSFTFDLHFLTREWPAWVGTGYADVFEAHLVSGAFQGPIALAPDGAPLSCDSPLGTWEMVGGYGSSGWLTAAAPCVGGETMRLELAVYDVGDGLSDSAVLLDDLVFYEAAIEAPWTLPEDEAPEPGEPVDDDDAVEPDDDDSAPLAPCADGIVASGQLSSADGSVLSMAGTTLGATLRHDHAGGVGCIAEARFDLVAHACSLVLLFERSPRAEHLDLVGLTWHAEAGCPGWDPAELGTWSLLSSEAVLVDPGVVEDPWAAHGCLDDATLGVVGDAQVRRADGEELELSLGDLRFVGDFVTSGTWGPGCEVGALEPEDDRVTPPRDGHGCSCTDSHGIRREAMWLLVLLPLPWVGRRARSRVTSAGG